MARFLVLDFGGTMMNAEIEGIPFTAGALQDIAALCGVSYEDVRGAYDNFVATQMVGGGHTWNLGGHAVAPANVDPYLRIKPAAVELVNRFWADGPVSEAFVNALATSLLYKYNYPKADNCFRLDALALIRALDPEFVAIVTNSGTEAVQAKLQSLIGDKHEQMIAWESRVFGNAKKYVVDPNWQGVRASLQLPGLARPVLLRRRLYYERLLALRKEWDCDWSDITVVGYIFELDLALPLELGCRVLLMPNEFTPAYEMSFLNDHSNGHVISHLKDAMTIL